MKQTIRYGVFETNSSSTHSFVITDTNDELKTRQDFVAAYFTDETGYVKHCCSNKIVVIKDKKSKARFLSGVFSHKHTCAKEEELTRLSRLLDEVYGEDSDGKPSDNPYCDEVYNNGTLSECDCLFYGINKELGIDMASSDEEIKARLEDILSDKRTIVLAEGWFGGDCEVDFEIL